MGKKILLGVTGSVAAVLTAKMVRALQELGEVQVVFTKCGEYFIRHNERAAQEWLKLFSIERGAHDSSFLDICQTEDDIKWYTDASEWPLVYELPTDDSYGTPVLHIELRKWADVLVIAPLTANTLAKLTHGICDNLLTSVARAWDREKPVVLAPAMNTYMWEYGPTKSHISRMEQRQWTVINPVEKELACGDSGIGAMAPIEEIVIAVKRALRISGTVSFHKPME